ncbi:hypothetical protein ABZ783_07070 [Micromonospora sp. NPDC047738]|uniref:hypothetical protein n=1 Tax=Micromonospora sp. NPDC047738 TaxID=3155741 RepID=UPI0033D1CC3F
MTAPYLAPSLAVLRAEINQRWPNRDRTSDGWIGDTAHQAQGSRSDHNPNARGSVDAIDVDEDGLDFAVVFAAIKRHPSARYVIYERKLYHRLRGWKPEPYTGPNPHDKHFHLSIDQTREAEQNTRPWGVKKAMTVDEFLKLLADPRVLAFFRSAPWNQEVGRSGKSTHDVLFADMRGQLGKVDEAVKGLAARPAVAVDYDQLADAIVRRVLTPPAS